MNGKIITQIGSLPYDNIEEAINYSLRHDIPFLPELQKLGDSILDYIKNPGQLSCLNEFKNAVRGYEIVKIQSIGPATLTLPPWKFDHDYAVQVVDSHISGIIKGLDAKEIILFLDEPGLGQVSINYEELWYPIIETYRSKTEVPISFGVHCCDNMQWDKLFHSNVGVDIISFDASKYDITIYPYYRGGKRIAWGIEKREDIKDFQDGDLLTLPCGIGTKIYNIGDAKKNLEKLVEIKSHLARL